jgi:hypothetical protein
MTNNRFSPFGYSSFDKVFPTIDEIEVKVKEEGDGFHYLSAEKVYYKNQIGDYIPCRNTLCGKQGFNVRNIIQDMVDNNETEKSDYKKCTGYEKSAKRDCYNHFNVEVNIKYKTEETNN